MCAHCRRSSMFRIWSPFDFVFARNFSIVHGLRGIVGNISQRCAMGEFGHYQPFNYGRICDVCGNRRRISSMVKLPGGIWCCDLHKDERSKVELDRLNAKKKPYNIIPVPNAKPGSQYPDVMEAEEAVIMNFVDRMVVAGTRYEQILSLIHI